MVSESSFLIDSIYKGASESVRLQAIAFVGQAGRLDAVGDKSIVAVIDDCFAVVEQRQLF